MPQGALPCQPTTITRQPIEIYRERDSSGRVRYVLLKTASATGNRLLRFASVDPSLVASILFEKIGGIRGFEEAAIRLLR